ncbi:MAG TPA: hypothetical protein VMI34_00215 [Candidatus Bathyarchaeia archaeon]|nr:hypothetical protein [Candidatus Bathyarchaeia archaeon]
MNPDAVWKAPVTAAELADRIEAQSRAALPIREIRTDSLEDYWREWSAIQSTPDGDPLEIYPPVLTDDFTWIQKGEGLLRLPDGSRWILASARLVRQRGREPNAFLRRLHALLLEHERLRRPHAPARTTIVLDADTLDVRRVFCTDCRDWRDLQADAEEADRTLGPWPAGAESRPAG